MQNIRLKIFFRICTLFVLGTLFVACSGDEPADVTPIATETAVLDTPTPAPTATATEVPITGVANVDSIQIMMLESFPVQVNVRVRGQLPDGCTIVDDVDTFQNGDTFNMTLTTRRVSNVACTTAVVDFDEMIALDVLGLAAGTYTVVVNERSGSFTLEMDNLPAAAESATKEPGANETAEPTAPTEVVTVSNASINGRIWHDLCASTFATVDAEETAVSGCEVTLDGYYIADGVNSETEPGIADLEVRLSAGACTPEGTTTLLATAVTDNDGNYSFTGLEASTYCVVVDTTTVNGEILLPGAWTTPQQLEFREEDGSDAVAPIVAATVAVAAGEVSEAVDFGWDYRYLPLPEVAAEDCVNSMELVSESGIADGTVVAAGTTFTKTWTLRNNGSCPWREGYRAVAVDNIPLAGDTVVTLTQPVAPGLDIAVTVALVAPADEGTYRSNWQLADSDGIRFGVNGFIEDAIWSEIVVGIPQPTPEPGLTTITGFVWRDFCTILGDGSASANCVETEEGSGFFRGNGSYNAGERFLTGVVVTLSSGVCPNDGTLPNNVVDTAVVDENGDYLITGIDGGTYCVGIDAFAPSNVDLLIPGDWTYPTQGVGQITVVVNDGEVLTNIDFGWDDADD